ncbi:hypothetical protein BKA65DRAFT_225601 [Rhexocercosporidium sp. MPI-PUGE-AT-0058]|nr:hypothetical protein BKA65DRAFT_225601 [Rhexocercosporidium sp. MPI-PUGE-AT-0058]
MAAPTTPFSVYQDSRFRQEAREAFDAEILSSSSSTKDKSDQLISIQSFSFQFIKDASRRPQAEAEAVQEGLYVLWHMFIETAKALEKDDPFQEKLVSLLLWTKELDSIHRSLHPTENATAGWESYGFADSLQTHWEQLLITGTGKQQCNLAAFSAKLFAVNSCQDSLRLTVLWYLRAALEVEDETKTIALLPAAVVWVDHCRHKLLTLSVIEQSDKEPRSQLLAAGELARKAGVDQDGFSLQRWLFWRRRFQELSHNEDKEVVKEAKKGFMNMIFCGRELDFDVPGEAKFTERLQAAMWEALVNSGKESVSGDEIDIDVDWVD